MAGSRITEQERTQIVTLYENGLSMRNVATETKRSFGTVHLVLHSAGVVIRRRGGKRL